MGLQRVSSLKAPFRLALGVEAVGRSFLCSKAANATHHMLEHAEREGGSGAIGVSGGSLHSSVRSMAAQPAAWQGA